MNARAYHEFTLHDGKKVRIFSRADAEALDREFRYIADVNIKDAHFFACQYFQVLITRALGDKYHWRQVDIIRILKQLVADVESMNQGEPTYEEMCEYCREEYGIDFLDDGMIRASREIDDLIYDRGEWRPLSDRKPMKDGAYLITTDRGAVTVARWHGDRFSGTAGAHAVAWTERPDPWEFWAEKYEEDEHGE